MSYHNETQRAQLTQEREDTRLSLENENTRIQNELNAKHDLTRRTLSDQMEQMRLQKDGRHH